MAHFQKSNNGADPRFDNRPLPTGWEMRVDRGTGWPFFIDHNSHVTTWTDPRNQEAYNTQSAPPNHRFREIPVQHEGHPAPPPGNDQPFRPAGSRQIPIQFEQGGNQANQQPESYGWKVNDGNRAPQGSTTTTGHGSRVPEQPSNQVEANDYIQPMFKPKAGSDNVKQVFTGKPQLNKNKEPAEESTDQLKPPQEQTARAASPVNPHLSPLEQVTQILAESKQLEEEVNVFSGIKGNKDYKYLEEMLTRKLLKLDNILSEGNEEIRLVRKQAVKTVQSSIDHLELKAFANEPADLQQNTNSHNNNANNTSRPSEERIDSGVESDSRENEFSKKVKDLVLDSELKC